MTQTDLIKAIEEAHRPFVYLQKNMQEVIVGCEELIKHLLVALLIGGHVLLEGQPGLAKSLIVTTLSKAIGCSYTRVQFTADLLPSDLLGTAIYNPQKMEFEVKKGPIFTSVLIADEINRAPAKVQSALLEAMGERQVSLQGETFPLPNPFFVLATQNPLDQEGTYPLSEAQIDRFTMKLLLHYPTRHQERQIIDRMAHLKPPPMIKLSLTQEQLHKARQLIDRIYIDETLIHYILEIIFAIRSRQSSIPDWPKLIEPQLSPRATLQLVLAAKGHAFLEGRSYVVPHDIKATACEVLRHRLHLTHRALREDLSADQLIDRLVRSLPCP